MLIEVLALVPSDIVKRGKYDKVMREKVKKHGFF